MIITSATSHCGPASTNQLLPSDLLVLRQKWTIVHPAVIGFQNWDYRYKPVATQISDYARFYDNSSPTGDRTFAESHSTNLKLVMMYANQGGIFVSIWGGEFLFLRGQMLFFIILVDVCYTVAKREDS